MPLCTVHLLALHPTPPDALPTFLSALHATALNPLVVSRVIRWIILPSHTSTSHLLARNVAWDLLLVVPGTAALPPSLSQLVAHHWRISAGVPSRLVAGFDAKNAALLHPRSAPPLDPPLGPAARAPTTQSSQALELSRELSAWIDDFLARGSSRVATGAVSMFNLLAFRDGMKDEYLKYGAAFAASIGSRHGGDAKIVGSVVGGVAGENGDADDDDAGADGAGWDEIALAHYPSIAHFRAMLASEDYQAVNRRHRVGSLRDTCILMTSEIAVEEVENARARL